MDRGDWWATVHGGCKVLDMIEWPSAIPQKLTLIQGVEGKWFMQEEILDSNSKRIENWEMEPIRELLGMLSLCPIEAQLILP